MGHIENELVTIRIQTECYAGIHARRIVGWLVQCESVSIALIRTGGIEALRCSCRRVADVEVPTTLMLTNYEASMRDKVGVAYKPPVPWRIFVILSPEIVHGVGTLNC